MADVQVWFDSSFLLPKLLGGYPWGKVYSVFLVVFQAANTYTYSTSAFRLHKKWHPGGFVGNNMSHSLVYSLVIMSVSRVVGGGHFKAAVDRCLDGLKDVETSLKALRLAKEYKPVKCNKLDWALTGLSVAQAVLGGSLYSDTFFTFYPTFLGFHVSLLIIYGHLSVVTLMLGALEERLDRLIRGMPSKTASGVECLAELAGILCSLAESLHSAFAPFSAVAFSFFFLCSVCTAYFFWNCLRLFDAIHSYYAFVNCAVCYLAVVRVVIGCTAFKNKSKEFNEALYTTLIRDTSRELIKSNKLRLHIAMSRKLNFTACGLFNIDFKLVHAMVATAVSYVIIINQFEHRK